MQDATKVLSDSPGLVEWLVGLAFSYRSLPDGQAPLVLFSDDKLSFYTKKCVAESNVLWSSVKTLFNLRLKLNENHIQESKYYEELVYIYAWYHYLYFA